MSRPHRPRLGGKRRFLLTVGVLFVVLGVGYVGPHTAAQVRPVAFLVGPVPLGVYAWVFVLAGVTGIVGSFWRHAEATGFVVLQVVCTAWGVGYIGSWLVDGYPRGWVLAGLFLALSQAIASVAGMLVASPTAPPALE